MQGPTNGKTLFQQVVYITELARDTDVLDGYIFQDCQIIGPAVLVPQDNTEYRVADSMDGTSLSNSVPTVPITG